MNQLPPGHARQRASLWRQLLASPAVMTLVGVLLIGALLTRWIASLGGPEAFREQFGNVAPLVTLPVHIVVTITPFPSDVICIANGTLYGFWVGAVLNWFGWFVASLVEFSLGRRARMDLNLESRLAQLPTWIRQFPVQHPVYLILSRQIPWLGGHVATLIPGSMGVHPSRFAWCSAIAIVPSSLLMAAIGAGLLSLATRTSVASL